MSGESVAQDVPRETLERLRVYVDLLAKWNSRINLVAPSTIEQAWSRHIEDSLQLSQASDAQTWCDLGSGGGFPGLVVAIAHTGPGFRMTLIESDHRKCAFLRTVIRETEAPATVLTNRIELAPPQSAEVVTARALAPLDQLLGFVERHLRPDGEALFLKGASWRQEVETAEKNWRFTYETQPSKTNPGSVILKIGECTRA